MEQQKTTVILSRSLHERLKRMAAERRESLGALMREALEEKVASHRPKPKSIGIGDSKLPGVADRASELYRPDSWRS